MLDQQIQTLTTVFSDVLETLAFMFTEDEPTAPTPGEVWLLTTIGYRGPVEGRLSFWCPREFSHRLTANLLGIESEEDASNQLSDDAVKEFMNVVCGQFITAAHGTHAVFSVTIPEITELTESPDFGNSGAAETAAFTVDGLAVAIAYHPGGDE